MCRRYILCTHVTRSMAYVNSPFEMAVGVSFNESVDGRFVGGRRRGVSGVVRRWLPLRMVTVNKGRTGVGGGLLFLGPELLCRLIRFGHQREQPHRVVFGRLILRRRHQNVPGVEPHVPLVLLRRQLLRRSELRQIPLVRRWRLLRRQLHRVRRRWRQIFRRRRHVVILLEDARRRLVIYGIGERNLRDSCNRGIRM